MADSSMKLELILLGKDMLGKILGKDIGFLKNFKKEGEAAAKAADKLDAARKKAAGASGASANAAKKETGEVKKLGSETAKAAKAQEKLNNAKRRKTSDSSTAKEVADKNKLASANEKAAKSEERLNNARRRGRGSRGSQSGIEDDLLAGGTGAGILWASKQGMTAAMTKQEAMTDLYTSFYRSSLSAAELNKQMAEGEKIADRLGNKLPGTTADFLQLFSTMKQRGIEANVILAGAGEAAANLAVANKEDVQEVGANIARFGQMFNLKTRDDYIRAADLMSRAKTTYGIKSDEMMEAVKDFSGRTGKGLGLDGGKGAEDSLRFLAFLRAKTGLQGLTVGNAASSFFNQYLQAKQKKKDPTEELKKLTGVDLKIFDDKGAFLGLENAVKEFAKLKGKLSDEQMVGFGNALAGEEGASIFQAMVQNGGQWGEFNEEMTNSMSLMDKSSKNAENFTNKLEALTGSLQNLGSAGFTPLLKPLSLLTDNANELVGYLTKLATAYPTTAATTSGVLTLGAAFLTLKAGTGIASRFLGGANSGIIAVGDNATKSASKVGKLKNSLMSTTGIFKALLLVELVGATWEQIQKLQEVADNLKKTRAGLNDTGKMSNTAFVNEKQRLTEEGKTNELPSLYTKEAESIKQLLQEGNNRILEYSLDRSRMSFFDKIFKFGTNPINDVAPKGSSAEAEEIKKLIALLPHQQKELGVDKLNSTQLYQYIAREMAGVEYIRNRAPSLQDPNVMAEVRNKIPQDLNFSAEMKGAFERMLQKAFPQSFEQSNQQLAEKTNQLNQAFLGLIQPSTGLTQQFAGLTTNSTTATTSVGNFANAANSAANRLNSIVFKPPTFSNIQIPIYSQTPLPLFGNPTGRARGGSMTKGHNYRINEIGQEFFTPAVSGSMVSNDILRKSPSSASAVNQNVTFSPTLILQSGSQEEINKALSALENKFMVWMREINEEISPRMTAKKFYSQMDRDLGRS